MPPERGSGWFASLLIVYGAISTRDLASSSQKPCGVGITDFVFQMKKVPEKLKARLVKTEPVA